MTAPHADSGAREAAALEPRARDVLDFWFGAPGDRAFGTARKMWFGGGPALDARLRERFGALVDAAKAGDLDAWARTPLGALALIVVLDQFSRSIHRGTPAAFAADRAALAHAKALVASGGDRALPTGHHRAFAYLPFEHDESPDSQREGVRLCAQIKGEAGCAGYHDFALRHAAVIERFGRFPHRNAILGRPSSDEEVAFLKEPGSSF
ncbi:DUF924 family protein [Burkholderia sp. MSMB1498]|uniref:DUF924 family protein n=1 Tax=Burkholderia sp. MSMB1498 TaxID=1637842 RepID=UPI000759F21F|nr:DUF924 family protein [Burkholderia sp. MSMB1498]KVK92010.1 hypothetical protein WS91_24660 [Burkholderia sp. MSMB1498]